MPDIRTDILRRRCDGQMVDVTNIRTDVNVGARTDRRLMLLTYGRTCHIGGMTDGHVLGV